MDNDLSDDDLQTVYCWVDSIQLSRPKRNISRDFADGGESHGYLQEVCNILYNSYIIFIIFLFLF